MTDVMSNDPLERLLTALEQEILAAPDSDLLADAAPRRSGETGRDLVAAVLADRARRSPRRARRPLPRIAADGRATVRQLLVASPRARDLVGRTPVDGLSDAQVKAILARLVEAGLLEADADADRNEPHEDR